MGAMIFQRAYSLKSNKSVFGLVIGVAGDRRLITPASVLIAGALIAMAIHGRPRQ
jgi:hypothetical protein